MFQNGSDLIVLGLLLVSLIFSSIFFGIIVSNKEYLRGKPALSKMWPVLLSSVCRLTASILIQIQGDEIAAHIIFLFVQEFAILGVCYAMYFGDDDSEFCCLFFKPFIFKAPVLVYAPNH